MPRRASSSIHPFWILVVAILIVCAVMGGILLLNKINDPYRVIASLDVSLYLENANSLRGNTYKIKGTILNSLAWSPEAGRLFSIEVESRGGSDILPILVPIQFNHVNIQKGQKFFLKIEVDDKGILKTRDLQKV